MRKNGFTLIELMVVVTIIGILAAIALPSYSQYVSRAKLAEAFTITSEAKESVREYFRFHGRFPENNQMAGISAPDLIKGNYVNSVNIINGAIHVNLKPLGFKDKNKESEYLSFRPIYVQNNPISPVQWLCGKAKSPDGMTIAGEDKTNLDNHALPNICRKH